MPERLVFVSDREPGISRRRAGKGFSYRGPDGKALDRDELVRIKALGVPPAYRDVWICARANGHLQATGRDDRGRKQYRYHPLWSEAQARTKYEQLAAFGRALPALRRRLSRDLQGEVGDRDFSLAALVLLLDRTCLRIGNPAYTAANRSFGASTLLTRHLSLSEEGLIQLKFRAKGGKLCRHILRDKRLNRILQEIGDLPGRNIFTYLDAEGEACCLHSHDVNEYLTEIAGEGMTAKTFRTWGGTLAAFELAAGLPPDARLSIRMMADAAAERLFNTPTICRKSYIHPRVLDLAAHEPTERTSLFHGLARPEIAGLRVAEARLLAYLESLA
ncbi:DNA topoisomerase IB [Paracoccus aestuariivivens]|uniref:DNA topoisomerase n=1 Tax=Paracoccus aestuariivivens TaxID=1820333 RepID=A0A6L6JGW3_9RHOB|nr:DNA topoisomerase IB [Paracoccus aestuariivivens]MTH79939.1 DNA topoisomerase IB [Paracoccus aestuariivivens]